MYFIFDLLLFLKKPAHEGHECPYCYGNISQRNVPTQDSFNVHTMCANCHSHLRNRICPICRAPSRPEYELGYEPDFQPDPENDTENIRENEIDNEDMNQLIYNNQYYRYFHNNNIVNDNIVNDNIQH